MSTSDKICNDGASKSNYNGVCEMTMLHNMKTADAEDKVSVCANCGKEGSDVTNCCNKCKMVKYCNAACKKKHRHNHKKHCEEYLRLAAKRAAKLHDEALFKQPPPQYEDCPICFLRMPTLDTGSTYMTCCGKIICSGCFYANAKIDIKKQLCAFCRIPAPGSDEEMIENEKKRMDLGDPMAIFSLGVYYNQGIHGFPQNYRKALELWHRAGELGIAESYTNIGVCYNNGDGVEMDKKKATHYYELAAMRGHEVARNKLGLHELEAGNIDRALQHWMIAVRSGYKKSLKRIQECFTEGNATKEDYATALRAYQAYLGEIKSDQRDDAASSNEEYCYY